jgi:hypothetical protein
MWILVLALIAAEPEKKPFTSPASPAPEYGHGLSAEEARAGWIALYDGRSFMSWSDAEIERKMIGGGKTTTRFGSCELKGVATSAGEITVGDQTLKVAAGSFEGMLTVGKPGPVRLGESVGITTLLLKPAELKPVFNGRDLSGWTILRHPKQAEERQTKWSVADGVLHAVGGPGAVELDGEYGDLVLHVEVRMRARLVNGGVFFRSIPGEFMNGYEAQLFNACYDHDPAQPARYSTGAIDDRQLARRLVSRDLEPFTMTVVAVGPHIATWVNGYQTAGWTDMRDRHENPREGLRLEAGTIQLQAHDPETDIEFRRVAIAEIK